MGSAGRANRAAWPPGGAGATSVYAAHVTMSASPPLGTNVNRGLAWVGIASSLVGVLDLLALLIIVGLWVDPRDYGTAALAMWMFPILDQATDLGLSAAVIQRDSHDHETISTVFWINLTLGVLLFVLFYFAAPVVAVALYDEAIVGSLLIAYATKLIWQNVYFIPAALMKRELRFKELSVIRICANVAEFAGKVGFAWAGFGIWCFVLGPLCRVLVTGIGCQICHPWRPKFVLRLRRAKEYTTFGLKTAGSQILFYFYTNIDYPIVGFYFGKTALGIYKLAYEIVLEPVRVISHVVVDIAFPTFSRLRRQRDQLIAQFIAFTRLNLVTVMTYSAVVFVMAPDLLALLFPDYIEATPTIRILCGVAILRSVSFVVPPLLDGTGNPTRTFVYTCTAAVTLPVAFVLFAYFLGDALGYESVALAWALVYPVAFAVLLMLAIYTLNITLRSVLRAVIGIPLCAVAATLVGFGTELAVAGLPVGVRLAVTSVAILGTMGLLLAYTQGLSVRGALRALKTPPPDPTPLASDAPVEPPAATR